MVPCKGGCGVDRTWNANGSANFSDASKCVWYFVFLLNAQFAFPEIQTDLILFAGGQYLFHLYFNCDLTLSFENVAAKISRFSLSQRVRIPSPMNRFCFYFSSISSCVVVYLWRTHFESTPLNHIFHILSVYSDESMNWCDHCDTRQAVSTSWVQVHLALGIFHVLTFDFCRRCVNNLAISASSPCTGLVFL